MILKNACIGRAAIVGLALSNAILTSARPFKNQYGEECDEYGNPIDGPRRPGRPGHNIDYNPDDKPYYEDDNHARYNSGNEPYYEDDKRGDYDRGVEPYYEDDKHGDYDRGTEPYYEDDKHHNYDNYDGGHEPYYEDDDYANKGQLVSYNPDGDYDDDYDHKDGPESYYSDNEYYRAYDSDEYDSDGYPRYSIDRDRDGPFNAGYEHYPYAGRHRTRVPYGEVINECTEPDMIALTFDGGFAGDVKDGYPERTRAIYDYLNEKEMVGTFFVHGNDQFDHSDGFMREMIDHGHQIGHQSLNYRDFSELNRDGIYREMYGLEDRFNDHLGYSPTYMRPPRLSSNDLILAALDELKYHVITADLDTEDWRYDSEHDIHQSIDIFNRGYDDGHRLVLAHDRHQWTLESLLPAIYERIQRENLRAVTVGECLGDPRENWYRRVGRDRPFYERDDGHDYDDRHHDDRDWRHSH